MTIKFTGGIATTGQLTANPQFTLIPTDEFFDSVVLLAHMNDESFTDETGNHTLNVVGSASISTSTKKFGAGSLSTLTLGSQINIADSDDWLFPGDFTVEFWAKRSKTTGGAEFEFMLGQNDVNGPTNQKSWEFFFGNNNIPTFTVFEADDDGFNIFGSALTDTTNFHHYAASKSSGTIRFFIDGVEEGTALTGITALRNSSQPLVINPRIISAEDRQFQGHMDEIRITKGVARYTSNFTPQTEEFPNQ